MVLRISEAILNSRGIFRVKARCILRGDWEKHLGKPNYAQQVRAPASCRPFNLLRAPDVASA